MRLGLVAALLLCCATATAAPPPLPPPPTRHLTDGPGLLDPGTAVALDVRLEDYERQTGHQILVWIGDTIGDAPLDDWAVKTFAAWKVGRKGKDDGLVMFVLAKDRKIDIEVGYGLEDKVTDARARQIIDDTMAPLLRDGKPGPAVTAGVDRILESIEGHAVTDTPPAAAPTGTAPAQAPTATHLSLGRLILYGVLGLLFLGFAVTHPQLAMLFLFNIFGGGGGGFGGGGGGGGDGGGFSGGGGRSGGGGARGSW